MNKKKKLQLTMILSVVSLLLSGCFFWKVQDSIVDKLADKMLSNYREEMAEATTSEKEKSICYLKTAIPLRESISISEAEEIADLKANEEVFLLSREDSWAKIRTSDGKEGYVLESHLSDVPVKVVDPDDTHWEYERTGLKIDINRHKDGNLVYWVADVYTENPEQDINTAFSGGSYKTCMETKEPTSQMAEAHDAIFAVNGDSVGFRGDESDAEDFKNPIVIRNGELCYEDERNIGRMCALMKNGKLKIFSPGDLGSGKQMIGDGVTDVWWFDTPLIENGEIVSSLYEVEESLDIAPYTAIGQKDKNNFIFIVIDGRGSNGSPGTTYMGVAELMKQYGAKTAYQLDGGGSSTIWFDGMVLNQPSDGYERPISDIIYVAK